MGTCKDKMRKIYSERREGNHGDIRLVLFLIVRNEISSFNIFKQRGSSSYIKWQ